MIMYNKKLVLIIVMLSGTLIGCPPEEYQGIILAHLSPQPVDSLHAVLLKVAGSKLREIKLGNPECIYYAKQSVGMPMYEIGIAECHGPQEQSDTGWGYKVSVSIAATSARSRPDLKEEVDELVHRLKQAIESQAVGSKVTEKFSKL